MLSYIDRFGVEAVTGSPVLHAGEMRRMVVTENIINAYNSRKRAESWGQWAQDNPMADNMLKQIEVLLNGD